MPAATIVAAWMSAEAGVGPSIASGSQSWNGNCADLPSDADDEQQQRGRAQRAARRRGHDSRRCGTAAVQRPIDGGDAVAGPDGQDHQPEHEADVGDRVTRNALSAARPARASLAAVSGR